MSTDSEELEFSWGAKRGRGKNGEVQFYESFSLDGVEYSLYDSVYLFRDGESKPYIGKLIKIWERFNKERKIKVLWFFYPSEISNFLQGVTVLDNELFLATGNGKGLANINPLESIAGKCNVVCISKDERNRQPSFEEVNKAHYVYFRTFDVENHSISENLGDKIATIDVNFLLNKNNSQSLDFPKVDSANDTVDLGKLLISINNSIATDGAVDGDANDTSLPGGKNTGERGLLDVAEDAAPVAGSKRKLIIKDSGDCKQSEGEDQTAGSENVDPVASSQNINLRSPDPKTKDVNGKLSDDNITNDELNFVDSGKNSLEDSVLPIENRNSKLAKSKSRPTRAVGKGDTDEQPLKKIKIGGTSLLSSDSGGTSTPKIGIVANNKASQSIDVASEISGRDRLTKKVNSVSNGLPKKIKSDGVVEDKSNDKIDAASVKQSKDKLGSAAVRVASSKASQPTNNDVQPANDDAQPAKSDAETDDKRNVCRKMSATGNGFSNKLKSNSVTKDKSSDKVQNVPIKEEHKDLKIDTSYHVKEVTQRPPDRSKWFTASPWEDRLKEAHDQGKLVLLHNLHPSYTSSEIEDIIWHGFGESCTAKVVQRAASSNRFCGQAFVILKTREIAEKILRRLDNECLMLPNGRPLVGSHGVAYFPGKNSSFPGHLVIDKLRHQMQREAREAVSTSHSAQPNTLEYEMAIEWRLLQDRTDFWWKMLHKRQGEEYKKTKASIKSQKAS